MSQAPIGYGPPCYGCWVAKVYSGLKARQADDGEMDPRLELGIEVIDAEHREMFRKLYLLKHLSLTPNTTHLQVMRSLQDLDITAREHLVTEEDLMENWPGKAEHAAAHQRLTGLLVRLLAKHKVDNPDFAVDVLDIIMYAEDWLKIHIAQEDSQFVEFVKSGQAAFTEDFICGTI